MDNGHTYECFHNLEIEVINAEINALHYSAHLFYEKAEVKHKMLQVINNFAIAKNYNLLRCGKLTNSVTQKQSSYQLATETDCEIEHGLVENFIQLFSLRDKFRKMRDDINENGFSNKYPSLMGNIVFNSTVNYKSAFFESLMTP